MDCVSGNFLVLAWEVEPSRETQGLGSRIISMEGFLEERR